MSCLLRLSFIGLLVLAPALAHAQRGVLESPGAGAKLSGVGFIAGWKCDAGTLTVTLNDGDPIPLASGLSRADTSSVCGTPLTGFITQINWATLGNGTHTAKVYDNGVLFAQSTFEVATLGEVFVRGARARVQVPNFPSPGESMIFEWNESTQHLELVQEPMPPPLEVETLQNSFGMNFVLIEARTFLMGSNDAASDPDERPVHQVEISQPFYLGQHEVTQEQWHAVMGDRPSLFSSCGFDCPVEHISWNEVQAFIRRLNSLAGGFIYRLPTEAEWEYAARAGTQTAYSFGDEVDDLETYAWYDDNAGDETHPVGQKQPNAWGLYDMHGNVWEWVSDRYGRDTYSADPVIDPTGPSEGFWQIMRGGSWRSSARTCRSAYRAVGSQDDRSVTVGFRLVVAFP